MSTFRVGQKVVCIIDGWRTLLGNTDETPPKKGQVLTIIKTLLHAGKTYLYFAEMPHDRGYLSSGFRPVVERKTDIAIFKAMLTPSKQKAEA